MGQRGRAGAPDNRMTRMNIARNRRELARRQYFLYRRQPAALEEIVNLKRAELLARKLMSRHGLSEWHFEWRNNWKRIFGACSSAQRTIYLSSPLAQLNSEAEVKDTVLHEIAHALTPSDKGHGKEWKRIAERIGAVPTRCYGSEVIQPEEKWMGACPSCSYRTWSYRRNRVACGFCCDEHNGGRYSDDYLLRWLPL